MEKIIGIKKHAGKFRKYMYCYGKNVNVITNCNINHDKTSWKNLDKIKNTPTLDKTTVQCKIILFIIQSRTFQEKSQKSELNQIKPEHNMGSHLNEKSQFHLKEPITNRYLIGI